MSVSRVNLKVFWELVLVMRVCVCVRGRGGGRWK